MIEKEKFERHLRGTNLSENTISSYLFATKQYGEQYDDVTQKKLREYKVWLIENYKPKTVNLRLRAINCYLECIGKERWKLPFVRVQQKAFLENVISEADYEYFKSCLKNDDEMFWYFVIRFYIVLLLIMGSVNGFDFCLFQNGMRCCHLKLLDIVRRAFSLVYMFADNSLYRVSTARWTAHVASMRASFARCIKSCQYNPLYQRSSYKKHRTTKQNKGIEMDCVINYIKCNSNSRPRRLL